MAISWSVDTDEIGNAYVSGHCGDYADLDPGHGELEAPGTSFLRKFDPKGVFLWGKTWDACSTHGQAVDESGNAFVCGGSYGTLDFDSSAGIDSLSSAGLNDSYLEKLNSDGNFNWARTWGTNSGDRANDVALDPDENPVAAGFFSSTPDFDPGVGIANVTSLGSWDVFISKFDTGGNFLFVSTWGGSDGDIGEHLAVQNPDGEIFVSGWFYQSMDFDPGSGVDNHASNSANDVFVSKLLANGGW